MVLLDLPMLRKLPVTTDGFPRRRPALGDGRLGGELDQSCGVLVDEVAPLGCLRQAQTTGGELLEGRACPSSPRSGRAPYRLFSRTVFFGRHKLNG